MDKQEFEARFKRLYKNCHLYCIHLDGFSHEVFYKDSKGVKHIEGYSAYASEQFEDDHEAFNSRGDMAIKSWNKDITKALFLGCSHYYYQHNAKEIIFEDVSKW